jgi:hypothetical protein
MIRKISRLKLCSFHKYFCIFYSHSFLLFFFVFFRTLNLSVLGIDSEIRIRLNLSNVPPESNRRKADPAFGTKIDVYFPTSFVQFSQAIMVNKKTNNSLFIFCFFS